MMGSLALAPRALVRGGCVSGSYIRHIAEAQNHSIYRFRRGPLWSRPKCSAQLASSSSSGRALEPPNIPDLAKRARLSITPEQAADWSPKIGSIVDWFSQLQEIDVEGIPPATRAGGGEEGNVMRVDTPHDFTERAEMLAAVPNMEGPYLKVPKILAEES
eukprot:TRINITY_DN20403_c0_g1_i1.p1 TRINITY_DN20403_c0_g1~~TRINITY_DN20403_c0_g1_i1.p1  ORF type:complete len:160 (+),score=18.20 TRINITY_DN20403_c0_g1_i1:23-502(+)